MAIFHATFDLNALIHRGEAARLAGHIRFPGAEDWATEAEIITHASILKAKGFEVLPTCDNHDAAGQCLGHQPE
jgi:hypothetical protein